MGGGQVGSLMRFNLDYGKKGKLSDKPNLKTTV